MGRFHVSPSKDTPSPAEKPQRALVSSADRPETQRDREGEREAQMDDDDDDDDDEETYRRRKGHRADLTGTSVDTVPLHNLWMSYTRSSSYLSSDQSESEDEEMWAELQELREKYESFNHTNAQSCLFSY